MKLLLMFLMSKYMKISKNYFSCHSLKIPKQCYNIKNIITVHVDNLLVKDWEWILKKFYDECTINKVWSSK